MAEELTLGIDLGGTNARAAVVDGEGRVRASERRALVDRRPEAVVEAIAAAVEGVAGAVGSLSARACGVGVAGQLAGNTGVVRVAPNLGWRDVPFGSLLSQRLRRSVTVVNDLSAAAWGEFRAGAGRGVLDLFVAFVGSGVGSAIIANGALVNGASGVAGELGHTKVVRDGRACGCGERGCLEAYVGGHNLIAQLREEVDAGRGAGLLAAAKGRAELLSAASMEKAALAGDPSAKAIFDRSAELLSFALANVVTLLNPSKLILGGGVLANCPALRARVVQGIGELAARVSREALSVHAAALGDDSGIVGAALLARAPT